MDFLTTLLILIVPLAFGFLVFLVLYALARKLSHQAAPGRNRLVKVIAAVDGLIAAFCLYVAAFLLFVANPDVTMVTPMEAPTSTAPPQLILPSPTPTPEPTEEQAEIATEPTATPQATETTTPSELPAFTPSPEPTAPLSLETTVETAITNEDKLGQLELEYPGRLRPGESASLLLAIYIPPELASVDPISIGRINISPDDPPILRELKTYYAPILVRRVMRIELTSPAFQIEDTYPATQVIDLDTADNPTFWGWDVVAPGTRGVHVLSLKIYRGEETVPAWVRSIEIEVTEPPPTPTDTPVPTATFTPTLIPTATFTPSPIPPTATITPTPTPMPFLQTPAGTALIGAGGTIMAALVTGLVTFYLARDSFPFVGTKARYRRRLAVLHNNLARLREREAKYGLNVPTELANEIEETEQQIAGTETKLAELEHKDE